MGAEEPGSVEEPFSGPTRSGPVTRVRRPLSVDGLLVWAELLIELSDAVGLEGLIRDRANGAAEGRRR
jgi:hypothetical protein